MSKSNHHYNSELLSTVLERTKLEQTKESQLRAVARGDRCPALQAPVPQRKVLPAFLCWGGQQLPNPLREGSKGGSTQLLSLQTSNAEAAGRLPAAAEHAEAADGCRDGAAR